MIPVEFYILVSGLLGAVIGMAGMSLYYKGRIRAKERETWKTADGFFRRMYAEKP